MGGPLSRPRGPGGARVWLVGLRGMSAGAGRFVCLLHRGLLPRVTRQAASRAAHDGMAGSAILIRKAPCPDGHGAFARFGGVQLVLGYAPPRVPRIVGRPRGLALTPAGPR